MNSRNYDLNCKYILFYENPTPLVWLTHSAGAVCWYSFSDWLFKNPIRTSFLYYSLNNISNFSTKIRDNLFAVKNSSYQRLPEITFVSKIIVVFIWFHKNLFYYSGAKALLTLIISIPSSWIFLWWMKSGPPFCKSSLYEERLPL